MARAISLSAVFLVLPFLAGPVAATPFFFSTGNPDGKMATATRPDSAGKFEIESADDFVIPAQTSISSATFTGLLTGGAAVTDISEVRVEIYRVFPADSDVSRTSGVPVFSTAKVPTRVNSPSDVEVADRDSAPSPGNLTFTVGALGSFSVLNSVQPGGIHAKPGQTSGGDGAVDGQEVAFGVKFTTPFLLGPGQYFFVPQVAISTAAGEFLWLSAPRPIVPPGTSFPSGFTDLQSWTRDEMLDPDWLRVGADIVGGTPAPTFNAAFSLTGEVVPEPATSLLVGLGIVGMFGWRRGRKQ